MAPAQGLFDNCIYRHGGFCLSATSSCPAISQMSSTLSSQSAKHSRWKMETLQQAIALVKIMLNRQFTRILHCSHDMYFFFFTLHTFSGFINFPVLADGDVNFSDYGGGVCAFWYLEASCYASVEPEFGVHFQSVCYSSRTLSQALTIAPSSLAPRNPLYPRPPLHLLQPFPLCSLSATSSLNRPGTPLCCQHQPIMLRAAANLNVWTYCKAAYMEVKYFDFETLIPFRYSAETCVWTLEQWFPTFSLKGTLSYHWANSRPLTDIFYKYFIL